MEVLYPRCAGIDVHKDTVMVDVRRVEKGSRVSSEVREFRTMTRNLLELSDWLAEQGVTHVAMESTGVYWKPIWNVLEGSFHLLLVNAQHVKHVPGRKTDVKDCQWLAELLQSGLLKGSFVPPRPLRELRDLTRYRTKLVQGKTRVVNRLHKVLEDANLKLGSVASDVLGVSGRAMLERIIAGEQDPAVLADLARRALRAKIPQLQLALEGHVTEHHRFLLAELYDEVRQLEARLERITGRIEARLGSGELEAASEDPDALPFEAAVELLTTIPGVKADVAEVMVSEMGTDMSRFPSADHLASWAGVAPGNHESAGKRKRGKTTPGNRWLRGALTQAAWAASRSKGTYLSALFRRLAGRRGKKRAIVATGHSILEAAYHMLATGQPYADLGPNHFDQLHPERLTRYLVKRLEGLGYAVTLTQASEAA
jgi:transposase